MTDNRPTVVIVGGGASGTLVAAQLLRRYHRRGLRVVIVEREHEIGRGVAYSTPYEYHRLNVVAEQMGAWPRDPRHFVRWASRRNTGIAIGDFAPRGLYGTYLGELLDDAERRAQPEVTLERVRDEAVEVLTTSERRFAAPGLPPLLVRLRDGDPIPAERVVLALGNLAPATPPGADAELIASGRYEPDPWDPSLSERAADDDSVLLLGTGLTMVDVALTLGFETFRPRLHAISRKGLLPRRHRRGVGKPLRRFGPVDDRPELNRLVRQVEDEIVATIREGGDWRQAIDSLRPVTNQIWMRFTDSDRRRFVERLSRRWDVHRHRMAPAVASMLGNLRRTGRLQIERASVGSIRIAGNQLEVELRREGSDRFQPVRYDRVINCTGPALDLASAGDPLIDSLFESGLARPGPLRLGIDHDLRGAVIGADGTPSGLLYEIGPVRKGRLWETTAIPEIRQQAFELADILTADLERVGVGGRPGLAVARAV